MAHYECKYCDRPAGYMGIPITVGDEQICACGAEWADAKILVEDEEISPQEQREIDEMYREMEEEEEKRRFAQELEEESDSLPCGCCACCGCSCDYEDLEDDHEDGSAFDEPDEYYLSHEED
ncbi:hypothetical protein D3C86_1661570 [compost metagenome]